MKIGIVAPAAAPANGIGIYAQQMADALSTNAVVESFWVGDEASGNHISIRKNHLADYESAAATMNLSCDVCLLHHAFSAYGWRDGGLVTVLAQRLRIPLVVVFHEVEHLAGENRRALGHALAEKAQQVIVMSKQAANVVEHLFKIPASIIKILHYGVPDFDVKSREDAKKIIGIGNRPIILCAGLMKPSDQLPIILDAVSSIVTKIPDLLFMHLGQSSYEEAKLSGSSYRHQLLLMARQYGLVNNVCFIDRFLPNDEWCTYLQCADLCIVAEADESTSQCAKLPMAMAAGLAIMSSPFLYANEILGDKLGEISAFDDARVLSAKMLNLLENPKQLALYRQAAGDFGAQFSWPMMAPKYLSLLKSVMSQHNSPLLFASLNDAQLLVPIQSVARCGGAANADVETLSWRVIGSATQLQCGVAHVNDITRDVEQFLETTGAMDEPHPMVYFALGTLLRQNILHGQFVAAQVLFKAWTKRLATGNGLSIGQLSLYLLGLCEYAALHPNDTSVLPLLRKWQRTLSQWFTGDELHPLQWPETNFSKFPELMVLAYRESSALLMMVDDVAVASEKALFIIDKLFADRYLLPLTGRNYPLVKVKRNEFVQWAEEAYWTMRLCQSLSESATTVDMNETIWQAYLWFLGDNNVRKQLVSFQNGSCANQIIGADVVKGNGSELFVAVLGLANEAFLKRISCSKNQASL